MPRSTYIRKLAERTRSEAAGKRLSPPRLLFRPTVAQADFTVEDPVVTPAAVPPARMPVSFPIQAAPAAGATRRLEATSRPVSLAAQPARRADATPPRAVALPAVPRERASTIGVVHAPLRESAVAGPAPRLPRSFRPAPSVAKGAAPALPHQHPSAPAALLSPARADASRQRIRPQPDRDTTTRAAQRSEATQTSLPPKRQELVTRPARITPPTAILPRIASPPRPAVAAAPRPSAQPLIQIGLIEVKVTPPAPHVIANPIPTALPPARLAPRATVASGGLTRGFGAFGLLQS
ncbi:hypothetical protein ABIE89_008518 [Bradyrhizobium niftali]